MRQQELVVRAIEKAGTGRSLAQATHHPETRISLWKHEKEPMPDKVIAELAVYLGLDPVATLGEIRGGTWQRVAAALKEKLSAGFDWLLSSAKPRRSLLPAG